MNPRSNTAEISIICAFFLLLSLGGAVWDFSSGLLKSGIDGIMLLTVCLMMAGIFALMLLVSLKGAGMLPSLKRSVPASAAGVKAPAQATQPTAQGK